MGEPLLEAPLVTRMDVQPEEGTAAEKTRKPENKHIITLFIVLFMRIL
jgi:hypothetical protein